MNALVEVTGAAGVEPWFRRVETTLSRFDPQSPLSQLNAAAGSWVMVPPLLYAAVRAAVQAARETEGAFDPTVLDALVAAGYGQSFELGPTPRRKPEPAGRWAEIVLSPALPGVLLPEGIHIDLGGIGKGLAVDGAARRLKGCGSLMINAGGDLYVQTALGDEPVQVDIADPWHSEKDLAAIRLRHGAVATSSTLGRSWGEGLHHIVDPRTGKPARSGVVATTAVGRWVSQAEVLAKACIVLGAERGLALLEAKGCHGLLVTEDGKRIATPGMEAYLYAAT